MGRAHPLRIQPWRLGRLLPDRQPDDPSGRGQLQLHQHRFGHHSLFRCLSSCEQRVAAKRDGRKHTILPRLLSDFATWIGPNFGRRQSESIANRSGRLAKRNRPDLAVGGERRGECQRPVSVGFRHELANQDSHWRRRRRRRGFSSRTARRVSLSPKTAGGSKTSR